VFEKHSDPSSYHRNPLRNFVMRLYAATERFTIRHADAAIGTGPGLVAQARAVQPRAAVHHIFDIPSSLVEADPARTAAVAARLRQAPDELLLIYVGSFAVYQGIDLLFEALPHVVRACPRARLVVIGGTPAEVAHRTAWLRARGLEAAVIWAGWVAPDELADYLAAADVLLSPRLGGVNTPLKLLDYLKAGRAIAATDTPANRLILDETTAELAPPEAAAFAAGIVRLLDDPARRAHLAAQGRELIRTRYNFAEFKRLLGECYAGLNRA
jgi:glycosyltransferase involved in cell wall biosynthesis